MLVKAKTRLIKKEQRNYHKNDFQPKKKNTRNVFVNITISRITWQTKLNVPWKRKHPQFFLHTPTLIPFTYILHAITYTVYENGDIVAYISTYNIFGLPRMSYPIPFIKKKFCLQFGLSNFGCVHGSTSTNRIYIA